MSAGPSFFARTGSAVAGVVAAAGVVAMLGASPVAFAQDAQPPAPAASAAADATPPVQNSAIDAQLFYLLLVGEMELRTGQPVVGFSVILEAAMKSRDEQLFRRATEAALQARSGDQALTAARAWRQAFPVSLDATRYVIQILVATNRSAEAVEPLRTLLTLTPVAERNSGILALPRLLGRNPDRKANAALVEQVLKPFADAPATRSASRLSMGRAWLAAQDTAAAMEIARRAHAQDPADEGAATLAIEAMAQTPEAEAIVVDHLRVNPNGDNVRLAYAGALSSRLRYADAAAQLDIVTQHQPTLAAPLMTLGALRLELREPEKAKTALMRYIELVKAMPLGPIVVNPGETQDDDSPTAPDRGLNRARLMLAQAADQLDDFKGAEAWLAQVTNPRQALEVQTRRASLLARQGKLAEGRALIRNAPAKDDADARAKVLAEVQLLRVAKQWGEADKVLDEANRKMKDDVDLLYEHSMIVDKLNRPEQMEQLLRRVIALKPDHGHAHNALGYAFAERNVRLEEAKQLIQRALDLAPGDPFITDSLGWVEYRLGNRDAAERLLREAYRVRPDTEIAAHLGEVLWASDRRDEARRIWREGRTRDAVNDVLRETLARLRVDL